MAATFLRLLVILLGFSHLLCFNAIPLTRIRRSLMHEPQGHELSGNINLVLHKLNHSKANTEKLLAKNGRMNIEVNDYPGSGANNRHTPKPQSGRVCVDC